MRSSEVSNGMDNQQGDDGKLRELALFAGAGGGILAGEMLGWRCIGAVEWEPYPASVLVARQNDGLLPPFPIWDNVCTFRGKPYRGRVDVISGGFPCQPFSSAAHGNHTAIDLWPEMRRVVKEVEPIFVFVENVAERAIEKACSDLEHDGWRCNYLRLSAREVGSVHYRPRWWGFGYADIDGKPVCPVNAKTPRMQGADPSDWWDDYPGVLGVDDGMAYRMDRLKAIGNGQVPQCAAEAWRRLIDQSLNC
jgi:DNA (cytosine-5)-methyltransferase 1